MRRRGYVDAMCRGGGWKLKARAAAGVLTTIMTVGFASGLTGQQGGAESGSPVASPGAIWWSFGAGGGSVGLTCEVCADDRDSGLALHLGVGATAHERLDVGLEVARWSSQGGGVGQAATRLDARTAFRPLSGLGLNLIGGVGWIGYSAGELDFSSVAVSAGAGWDVPVADRWRVGARVMADLWSYGSFVSTRLGDTSTDVSISVTRVELVLSRR